MRFSHSALFAKKTSRQFTNVSHQQEPAVKRSHKPKPALFDIEALQGGKHALSTAAAAVASRVNPKPPHGFNGHEPLWTGRHRGRPK